MQNTPVLIELKHLSVSDEDRILLNDINFKVSEKQSFALLGPSGSGKTSLGKVIAGLFQPTKGEIIFYLPSNSKRSFVTQQHDFRDFYSRAYYQQRYDQNYGNESPLVIDVLKSSTTDDVQLSHVVNLLQLEHLTTRRLIELSNGEGKRLQLAKALLQQPTILVLDSPFIGLDVNSRAILHDILNQLIENGIVIFIITTPDEIPTKITHVVEMEKGSIRRIIKHEEFIPERQDIFFTIDPEKIAHALVMPEEEIFSIAVQMQHVNVQYQDKVILEDINWTVKKGENWALTGPNGAGKSTLLSLINGDNPKAYTNNLWLFDQKRGSGESIWEIKNKIGYLSPELHLYYQRNPSYTEAITIKSGTDELKGYSQPRTTCFEAVASGFNDQIGSSQKITSLQMKMVEYWMEVFQIDHLKKIPLYKISLGEQRIVLLARALVKNPPLLILDEPCHGLDEQQTKIFTSVVDAVCMHFEKTLIYVSHYPKDIPSCVNRFIRLEKGRVAEII